MLDRDEPQAGAVQRAGAGERLPSGLSPRLEAALVEHLRCELTDLGRQSPGLLQEQSAIGGDRLSAVEHVLESGHRRALRVQALDRLLELLRVAEQHEAFRAGRDGEHVGERHLPGLVYEQHVHGLEELLARPHP